MEEVKKVTKTKDIYYGHSGHAKVTYRSDYIDHDTLDTDVDLSEVKFCIAGSEIDNFHKDFAELIKKYFI